MSLDRGVIKKMEQEELEVNSNKATIVTTNVLLGVFAFAAIFILLRLWVLMVPTNMLSIMFSYPTVCAPGYEGYFCGEN